MANSTTTTSGETTTTLDAAVKAAEAWRRAAEPGWNRLFQIQSGSWGRNVFEVVVMDGDEERKDHCETADELGITLLRLIRQD